MRKATTVITLALLSGCAAQVENTEASSATKEPLLRGTHSGIREKVGYYYSVNPVCDVVVYPEIRVVRAPDHGSVSTGKGDDYPNFARDNVRYDCNRRLVGSTEVFYASNPDFHGKDSFVIAVTFANGTLQNHSYIVEVH